MTPKYPDIHVQLTGEDGNGFFIISRVMKAMRQAKVPKEEIDAFMDEAMSGDYDNLLRVCMETVEVS